MDWDWPTVFAWINTPWLTLGKTPISLATMVGLIALLAFVWWFSTVVERTLRRVALHRNRNHTTTSTVYAYTRLVRYVVRDRNERQAGLHAEKMAREVAKHSRRAGVEIDILGPTPAFVAKVRGEYQWQFVVRAGDLDAMLDGIPTAPGWVVDVDPQSMM